MEQWDLLDENGQPTGRTLTRGEPLRNGQYHLVEHIWIVDAKGRLLIQRRADHLRMMPGVWAANSGSAQAGEDSESAARRELFEELSIRTVPGELVYGGRMRRRNSFTDIWILYRDIDPATLRLQQEEVSCVRWVTADELITMLQDRRFHHYGVPYFQFVFRAIERGQHNLYVCDLDGTLLNSDQRLSDYTVETLNHLIDRGMMIAVATARGAIGIELVQLRRLRLRLPAVLLGGAVLYDVTRRRILQSCDIPTETVDAVLQVFRNQGGSPQVYRRMGNEIHIYYSDLKPHEEAFVRRVAPDGRSFERFYHKIDTLYPRPAIFFSSQDTYARQKAIKDRLDLIPGIRATLYKDTYLPDNWFLEISRNDAGKDDGVERLCQHARASRIVAFGDNYNDLPMFRMADYACCMGNAPEEIKSAADTVLLTNDEDGVAQYLLSIYNRKL